MNKCEAATSVPRSPECGANGPSLTYINPIKMQREPVKSSIHPSRPRAQGNSVTKLISK